MNPQPSGILVVDKPAGMTSHDVVAAVRRAGRLQKVGHTGTLDPFATGVLPLCIGHATRLAAHLTVGDKEYRGVVRLGARTDTQDLTGTVIATGPVPEGLDVAALTAVAARFLGEIEQMPPMYSAVKVDGKRLYTLAREGVEVERAARRVHVHRLDVLSVDGADVTVDTHVSKGTYIRTLADDIGEVLGCGGHLAALRRTRAGAFGLDRAVALDRVVEQAREGRLGELLVPMVDALPELPRVELSAELTRKVLDGMAVFGPTDLASGALVRMVSGGELVALGEVLAVDGRGSRLRPRVVFPRP